MDGFAVISECYIDTCLIETILSSPNCFNHQKGCGNVSKVMREKFNDRFAVGIIDKDKKEIAYLQEFDLVSCKDSLFLYKHQTKHQYIIQISPAVEMFFLKAAEEKEIDITEKYHLPKNLKELTKLTKQISDKGEKTYEQFRKLFKELSDTVEFCKLARLIRYLGEKKYQADVEVLKNILSQ